MADDADEIARIAAEQRATPEDLKPQPDPPAPETAETPAEAAAPETPAEEVEATPETPAEPEPAKAKKSPVSHLTGRIGNLTAKLNEADARVQAAEARLAAAEALLNARGTPLAEDAEAPPAADPAPRRADLNPTTGRVYTEAEFQAAVAARTTDEAFNRQADSVYNVGAEQFPDWKESVEVLNASGIMSRALLDAALAVGDEKTSAAVLHRLGSDLEEAQRIAGMASAPARMGVELAKIAAQVSQPQNVRVSAAPPPIPTVRGAVSPTIDLQRASESDDMSAWIEARKKAGDPYAIGRKERAAMSRAN